MKRSIRGHILYGVLGLMLGMPPLLAVAQQMPDSTLAVHTEAKRSGFFPPRFRTGGLIYLPQAQISSERGFGLGAQILRPFRWPGSAETTPLSDVGLSGMVTFKGQIKAELKLNLNWGSGDYYLKSRIGYSDHALRYWGIGPDTPSAAEEIYRPEQVSAYVELFRRIASHLRVGLRTEFERYDLREIQPGGLLDTPAIASSTGKIVLGAGLTLDWNDTNRRYSPTSGRHYQFFAMIFDDELGSQHDFNVTNLDLRQYFPLARQHVLALQFFFYEARGAAPFWRLAALGGRHHTRGYRRARYLDRTLVSFQGEYRFPVLGPLSAVGYGGLGDVAGHLDEMKFEQMRLTAGGGLRWAAGTEDAVRIRFDVALGRNSARFYLSLGEAF